MDGRWLEERICRCNNEINARNLGPELGFGGRGSTMRLCGSATNGGQLRVMAANLSNHWEERWWIAAEADVP